MDCAECSSDTDTRFHGLFAEALCRVCQDVHHRIGINHEALEQVEILTICILKKLCESAPHSVQDVENYVVSYLLPTPINQWAIEQAHSVIKSSKKSRGDRPRLPWQKLHPLIKEKLGYKIDNNVTLFITTILEYVATDILKLTGNYVKNIGHTEITYQDLKVAMRADKVLMELFYRDADAQNSSSEIPQLDSQQNELNDIINSRVNSVCYNDTVKELIIMEQQFVRDLEMIIKVFRQPFTRVFAEDAIEVQCIFSNVLDIYEFAVNFLASLEDTTEMSRDASHTAVGCCFLELAEAGEFDHFAIYASDILDTKCLETLTDATSHDQLSPLLEQLGVMHRSHDVGGFLLAMKYVLPILQLEPILHCFKYFEYIELLYSLTQMEEDQVDLQQCRGLLVPLKTQMEPKRSPTLARQANCPTTVRVLTSGSMKNAINKLNNMKKSIENWDNSPLTVSEFIYEGYVGKPQAASNKLGASIIEDTLRGRPSGTFKRIADRYAFLFDTMIVLCKGNANSRKLQQQGGSSSVQTQGLKFKERISLERHFKVKDRVDDEDLQNSFELSAKDRQTGQHNNLLLVARNATEKAQWMCVLVMLQMKGLIDRRLEDCKQEEIKLNPIILPPPSLYKFAEPDQEGVNIVFENYTSSSGMPVVKSANMLKLVERLTFHTYVDHKFLTTFLTTYRSFEVYPPDFLILLMERFRVPDPADFKRPISELTFNFSQLQVNGSMQGSSGNPPTSPQFQDLADSAMREALKRYHNQYMKPIQFRVMNVLRNWIDGYWYDFEAYPELIGLVDDFLNEVERSKHVNALKRCIVAIRKVLIKMQEQGLERPAPTWQSGELLPVEWHLTQDPDKFDLMTLHPLEFARQVTLYEHDLYKSVRAIELVGLNFMKKDKNERSARLMYVTRRATAFTYFLEQTIVKTKNMDERVAVMARIMELLIAFVGLNNFNGILEVNACFSSASVQRLEFAWERVRTQYPKLYKEYHMYQGLYLDPHHSYLLEQLHKINPPCVPFFGVYLSKLVYVDLHHNTNENVNKTNKEILSFQRCRKIAEVINEIRLYQNESYPLRVELAIRAFIENINPKDEHSFKTDDDFETYLFECSHEIEPKSKILTDFPQSRDYSLKSPGIKPSKSSRNSSKSVTLTSSSQPVMLSTVSNAPHPLFTPLLDYGKDRNQTPRSLDNRENISPSARDNNCIMSIIDIKPGQQPKFVNDVRNGQQQPPQRFFPVEQESVPPAPVPPPLPPRPGRRSHTISHTPSDDLNGLGLPHNHPPRVPPPLTARATSMVSSQMSLGRADTARLSSSQGSCGFSSTLPRQQQTFNFDFANSNHRMVVLPNSSGSPPNALLGSCSPPRRPPPPLPVTESLTYSPPPTPTSPAGFSVQDADEFFLTDCSPPGTSTPHAMTNEEVWAVNAARLAAGDPFSPPPLPPRIRGASQSAPPLPPKTYKTMQTDANMSVPPPLPPKTYRRQY